MELEIEFRQSGEVTRRISSQGPKLIPCFDKGPCRLTPGLGVIIYRTKTLNGMLYQTLRKEMKKDAQRVFNQ